MWHLNGLICSLMKNCLEDVVMENRDRRTENLNHEELQSLLFVEQSLSDILQPYSGTDHDDYCDCTIESPSCEQMRLRSALREVRLLTQPMPESNYPERLANFRERVFFEQFSEQCERYTHVNNGWGLCDFLVGGKGGPRVPTQSEMNAMAAFAQWLGTNCGGSYLATCEREISKREQLTRHTDIGCHANTRGKLKIDKPLELFVESLVDDHMGIKDTHSKRHVKYKIERRLRALIALFLHARGHDADKPYIANLCGMTEYNDLVQRHMEKLDNLIQPVTETVELEV